MASSVSASSSQTTTDAATNTSAVYGSGSVTITVGNFYGLQSWGRVWIGGQNYDIAGPTSMSQGASWSWSAGRGYTHDANGYRGDVGVSVEFWVDGTSYHAGSAGAATQGAVDYDRKPSAPSTVTPVANADKTITVTSNAVTSYASTPTYYVQWAASDNNSTWGSWSSDITIASNARTYTFGVGSLTFGKYYKFRMKASNSDGTSAYTESASVFLAASGKRYTGSAWANNTTGMIYNGSAWVPITTAKRYNGTTWVQIT